MFRYIQNMVCLKKMFDIHCLYSLGDEKRRGKFQIKKTTLNFSGKRVKLVVLYIMYIEYILHMNPARKS